MAWWRAVYRGAQWVCPGMGGRGRRDTIKHGRVRLQAGIASTAIDSEI